MSLTLRVQILEQTVVTASKAGEADVQATPMAVTVLTGTELARMQDRTVEDLAARVPGMTFSQNTGLAQVTIRGIGTNAVFAGSDPSSAVYLDGVYLARPAMVLADFLDLERVEVLRGPQGTLYGRNSLGGAVNLITKSPTNEREGSIRLGRREPRHVSRRRSRERPHRSRTADGQCGGPEKRPDRDGPRPRSPGSSAWRRGPDRRARAIARRAHPARRVVVLGGYDAQRGAAALLFEDSGGQAGVCRRQPRRLSTTCAPRFPPRATSSSPARRHASRWTSRRRSG